MQSEKSMQSSQRTESDHDSDDHLRTVLPKRKRRKKIPYSPSSYEDLPTTATRINTMRWHQHSCPFDPVLEVMFRIWKIRPSIFWNCNADDGTAKGQLRADILEHFKQRTLDDSINAITESRDTLRSLLHTNEFAINKPVNVDPRGISEPAEMLALLICIIKLFEFSVYEPTETQRS